MTRLRRDLRWALAWSWGLAACFSAYVLIVSVVVPGGYAERYGSGPWTIVAGYWGIATVAAAILGLVRPLLRYGFGTFLIGSVIGTFVYGSFAWVLGQQIAGYWWVWLIPGTLVGGGLSLVWRSDPMLTRNRM